MSVSVTAQTHDHCFVYHEHRVVPDGAEGVEKKA